MLFHYRLKKTSFLFQLTSTSWHLNDCIIQARLGFFPLRHTQTDAGEAGFVSSIHTILKVDSESSLAVTPHSVSPRRGQSRGGRGGGMEMEM